MKNSGQEKSIYTSAHVSTGITRPMAPIASRLTTAEKRTADPSSTIRSNRYPIPASFEYRMRFVE